MAFTELIKIFLTFGSLRVESWFDTFAFCFLLNITVYILQKSGVLGKRETKQLNEVPDKSALCFHCSPSWLLSNI